MGKLLRFLDDHILKFGVAFAFAFIVLYPKLPSIYITHTWVYIRLEDFVISALVIIWFIQFVRRKVSFPLALGVPIVLYWLIGLASAVLSIVFISPDFPTYFSKLAWLEYLRRIEYMVLFFVAISSVKTIDDVKLYIKILFVTLTGVLLYGFGQRWYLILWHYFPGFFSKHPFCFPSFQTGNEEFAKGIPLCIPFDGRITSTFGGHYDLAGFLVIVLPVIVAILALSKRIKTKIFLWFLTIGSIAMIIFTASRVAFVSYLVGVPLTLIFIKKKWYILPIFLISLVFLVVFSNGTMKRFAQTFRIAFVVTNNQGQVVGVVNNIPSVKKTKAKVKVSAPPPNQSLPEGSSFIVPPQAQTEKTDVAIVQTPLSLDEAKKLDFQYGGIELTPVSGNFTVQKAIAYDISFTTRFQGEWPHAWANFMREPALGSGFATVSLATDNDFLRSLAETGILGLGSFILVFVILGVLLKESGKAVDNPWEKGFIYGLAGGVIGLTLNATLFDIFEASKVAEPLWLLLGIGAGAVLVSQKKSINYWVSLAKAVTSSGFLLSYLFLGTLIIFLPTISNFFVGDDFTWLKWAATALPTDLPKYFIQASGFFYRPLDKLYMVGAYSLFAFRPDGYHFVNILFHFITTVGVYVLVQKLFKQRLFSFIAATIFLLLPSHAENLFWISTMSLQLYTVFVVWGVVLYIRFREKRSVISYILALLLMALGLVSYEGAVVSILLFLLVDMFVVRTRIRFASALSYVPFVLLEIGYALLRISSRAGGFSGDYSYNLVKFVPNAIGNFVGYASLFVVGESTFSWYGMVRATMRAHYVPLVVVGAIVFLLLILAGILKRSAIFSDNKNALLRNGLFGISFAIVALLPFIGLGNIAERYLYLASMGFIIVVISLLAWITTAIFRDKKIVSGVIYFALLVSFVGWAYMNIQIENTQWNKAGQITKNMLGFLKKEYPNLHATDTMYVLDGPIKYQNAWVFPVGLQDAIWFVYREDSPKIIVAQSTQVDIETLRTKTPYIFAFEKNGSIQSISQ